MKRVLLADFWPPALGGLLAIAAALLLRTLIETRLLAELALDAMVDVMPGQDFSTLLGVFGPSGKALFFASALLAELAFYVAAWARLRRAFGLSHEALGQIVPAATMLVTAVLLSISVLLIVTTDASLGTETGWLEYTLVTAMTSVLYAGVAGVQSLSLSRTGIEGLSIDAPAESRSRRQFLGLVPGVAAAGLALVVIGRIVNDTAGGGVQRSRRGQPTQPITPTGEFYVVSKNLIDPQVNASKWALHVGGLVDSPLELTYEQLMAYPAQEQYTTMQCISNYVGGELISNALWRGVPLRTVLNGAGVQSAATHLLFRCQDGYTETLPLDFALRDPVILAYQMNSEPLTHKHGFPVRLLAPGKYGVKHPKWITDIMLMDEEVLGYWQQQGWTQEARMNTSVRIDVPRDGGHVAPGATLIEGLAFSGGRGISRVEVSTDDGETWSEATLKPPLGPYTWVLWQYEWRPDASFHGRTKLAARATDGEGQVQTSEEAEPYPSGATGYHRVDVTVDEAEDEDM